MNVKVKLIYHLFRYLPVFFFHILTFSKVTRHLEEKLLIG